MNKVHFIPSFVEIVNRPELCYSPHPPTLLPSAYRVQHYTGLWAATKAPSAQMTLTLDGIGTELWRVEVWGFLVSLLLGQLVLHTLLFVIDTAHCLKLLHNLMR